MSVHVISWVLAHSEAKLGDRLVLIVLADHAKSDGTMAWPSVATIQSEARLSRAQVHRCLRSLERDGRIVSTGKSQRGTIIYKVVMADQEGSHIETSDGAAGVSSTTNGGLTTRPEPSLEQPSGSNNTFGVVGAPTAQTVVGEVVDVFREHNVPLSSRHRGMIGQQAADLLESGFPHELVVLACVTAVRRGEPQNAHFIAADLAVAHAGQRITRRQYERALEDEMEIAAREKAR